MLALAGAGALTLALAVSLNATITERIVADRHSGLAIDGYDPVAYFTEGAPRQGRPELEHAYGGGIWRFRNEGNRAAFASDPQVYMPCFGGYDPTGVARGVAAPGHPLVFAVAEDRLCLFFGEAARAKFLAAPGATLRAAESRWPEVSAKLAQ